MIDPFAALIFFSLSLLDLNRDRIHRSQIQAGNDGTFTQYLYAAYDRSLIGPNSSLLRLKPLCSANQNTMVSNIDREIFCWILLLVVIYTYLDLSQHLFKVLVYSTSAWLHQIAPITKIKQNK